MEAATFSPISTCPKARGLTQAEAREILGIKQPHVSALLRNRSGMFSVERLMEFLTDLGQDVEITVRPTRSSTARCRSSWPPKNDLDQPAAYRGTVSVLVAPALDTQPTIRIVAPVITAGDCRGTGTRCSPRH